MSNSRKLDELRNLMNNGVVAQNTTPLAIPDFGTEAQDKEAFNDVEESLANIEHFKEKVNSSCFVSNF